MTTPLPRGKRLIIATLAIVSSLHAMYFIQNAWLDREVERGRTLMLEHELAERQQKLVNHDLLVEHLKQMRDALVQLEQILPSHLDLSAIETALREQASRSHVEITKLSFGPELVREDYYAEAPSTMMIRGKTADVLTFFDQLLSASPLRRISEMEIEPIDSSAVHARLVVMYDHSVIDAVL